MLKYIKSFDGKRIFYYINRASNNKPFMIFLHCWGGNHTLWTGEALFFNRRGYNTISIDLRGHGMSDKPENDERVKISDFCNDLREIIRTEKIKKVIMVGHSLGGMIAIKSYRLFPSKVKAIILLDSTYKFALSTLNPFLILLSPFGKIMAFLAMHSKKRPKSVDYHRDRKKSDLDLLFKDTAALDFNTGKEFLRELFRFDVSDKLANIKAPTLIIRSRRDMFFRKFVSEEMHKKIDGSDLQYIKGDHTAVFREPRDINKTILKFLESKNL